MSPKTIKNHACLFHTTLQPLTITHDFTVLYVYKAELTLLSNLCWDKLLFGFHKRNGILPPLNLRPLGIKECAPQYLHSHTHLSVPLSLIRILEYF